jgi:prefoldin alpha subunit
MVTQNEIQKKLLRYQLLDNRIKSLNQRRELLVTNLMEIESTLNTIKEIQNSKGKDILLALGSNVLMSASLKKSEKMIIGLGSNITIEATPRKTKKVLEKRKKILQDSLKSIQEDLIKLSDEFSKLEPEIQALIQASTSKAG